MHRLARWRSKPMGIKLGQIFWNDGFSAHTDRNNCDRLERLWGPFSRGVVPPSGAHLRSLFHTHRPYCLPRLRLT
nr:unnamed protein product [Callosobruchus chinensis]